MKPIFYLLTMCFIVLSCDSLFFPGMENTGSSYPRISGNISEQAEFKRLMQQDSINKGQKSANAVNVLLDDNTNKASVRFVNNSNCNIIVRFSGIRSYSLPVRKRGENFIVIDKGNYTLSSNLCNSIYSTRAIINDSQQITLNDR